MINKIVTAMAPSRIFKLRDGGYLLYSGNPEVDLNAIKQALSRYQIKAKTDEQFSYIFEGEAINSIKIQVDREIVYIIDDVFVFKFNGMPDIISTLKKYGTEKIIIENSGIQIKPRLTAIDRYNFYTVQGEKVSVGNFMVHFGDYMSDGDTESFFRYLYSQKNKFIESLMQSYAPIIKKTNFENILGYAQVHKFYSRIVNDTNIQNYSPMADSTYCILINDAPMKFMFDRVEHGYVVVKAEIAGEFRRRIELPQFDPYILMTSRKMSAMPSVVRTISVPNGRKTIQMCVYVSILKFSKPDMFKDGRYTVDLLQSPG